MGINLRNGQIDRRNDRTGYLGNIRLTMDHDLEILIFCAIFQCHNLGDRALM